MGDPTGWTELTDGTWQPPPIAQPQAWYDVPENIQRTVIKDGALYIYDANSVLRILIGKSGSNYGITIFDPTGLEIAQGLQDIDTLASDFSFGVVEVDIGLTVTVNVASNRRLRLAFHTHIFNNDFVHPGGNNTVQIRVMEGATELARRSQANIADSADSTAKDECDIDGEVFVTPTQGAHTYKLTAQITHGPSENMTIVGGATDTAYLSVEDMGSV